METLVKEGQSRLIGVCDISCDLQGITYFLIDIIFQINFF